MIVSYARNISPELSLGASVKALRRDQGYSPLPRPLTWASYNLPVPTLKVGLAVKNVGVQTKAFIDETSSLPMIVISASGYNMLTDR